MTVREQPLDFTKPNTQLTEAFIALQEDINQLRQQSGFKPLCVAAAALLRQRFQVCDYHMWQLTGRKSSPSLAWVGSDPDRQPEQAVRKELAAQVSQIGLATLSEGHTVVEINAVQYALAVIEHPQRKLGCLLSMQVDAEVNLAAFDLYISQLQAEANWLRRLETAETLIYRDDLTGLYNNRYFDLILEAELRRADRFQNIFSLLFIDLDKFKPVNDTHGHLAGSQVLKQVADILRDAVREVDIAIRYGGDEFVVLLLGASCAKAQLVAERVRRAIEQAHFRIEGGATARLTASIGVASYPDHGRDRKKLIKMADETMYHSKRGGKNRVTVLQVPPRDETSPTAKPESRRRSN